MQKLFNAEFFAGNRKRLLEKLESDAPVILTANGVLQRSSDNQFPFQQDKNFWYLTGINEPDIEYVHDGRQEYLIVPERSASREAFDGAVDFAELSRISGIKHVFSGEEGWRKVAEVMERHNRVYTLVPPESYLEFYGMYTNPARQRLLERLKQENPEVELMDVRPQLADLRVIKQPPEIQAIQKAIDITIEGLQYVLDPSNLRQYRYEYEIEAELNRAFRRSGGGGHAFAPIVAGGKRACTFHNFSNQARLKRSELVVMDVGAEYNQYAADLTRTIAPGKPTERQQAVYDAVLDAQNHGITLMKPGISFADCEKQVRQRIGENLRKLGLIDEPDKDSIHKYYPHSPHYLGLDVHDQGDYRRPMEPGMVMTLEPGIYIPDEGIGVRIEDDILITESGCTVLSAKLPKALSPL